VGGHFGKELIFEFFMNDSRELDVFQKKSKNGTGPTRGHLKGQHS
jgi:hypothetical protein